MVSTVVIIPDLVLEKILDEDMEVINVVEQKRFTSREEVAPCTAILKYLTAVSTVVIMTDPTILKALHFHWICLTSGCL